MLVNLTLLWALSQTLAASLNKPVLGFSPVVLHKTYSTHVEPIGTSRVRALSSSNQPIDVAKQFVGTQLKFSPEEYVVKDITRSEDTGVTHIYLRQVVDNREVYNANINVNISPNGQVISFGDSFLRADKSADLAQLKFPLNPVPATKSIEALLKRLSIPVGQEPPIKEAPRDFASKPEVTLTNVPTAVSDVRAQQGWIQIESGRLEPVWDFKLELKLDYYHGHISTVTNEPVSLVNWVHRAAYRVLPFGTNDPLEGGRELIVDPADKVASPKGWHELDGQNVTNTAGNNVIAVNVTAEDPRELDPEVRVDGGNNLVFDFPFEDKVADPETYQSAAITNLFYYTNMLHDVYYRFGFDEASGNFQQVNFNGGGGRDGDGVIASGQDLSHVNNAFFSSPPDGEHGRITMLLFTGHTPKRDSDFDNGILIHEYTHGLSTRVTGGPSNSDCLDARESGGLGEGWSDAIATIIRMKEDDTRASDKGLGEYVTGRVTGRTYMYSTSMATNPATFAFLDREMYHGAHFAGEIWATIIYELYWNLRDKLGATQDWLGDGSANQTRYGNTLLLRLLIDGMKLQPCNPTFINARDAIIQAENLLTGGDHTCDLWEGFAKRGMGINAKVDKLNGTELHINSFELPKECAQP